MMFVSLLYIIYLIHTANARNFYKILGLKRNCGEREIKKAFRKLSLKYHPDKCSEPSCTKKFTNVNSAYQCLSDPEKRKIYDQHGEKGLKEYEARGGANPMDPFAQFFGFGQEGGGDGDSEKNEETRIPIDVDLKTLYLGDSIDAEYERDVMCNNWDECEWNDKGCAGPGIRLKMVQMGPFMQQMQSPDDRCIAAGKRYKKKCRACPKGPTISEIVPLSIDIDAGMKGGDMIVKDGYGNEAIGKSAGNLVLVIKEAKHPYFIRSENDLHLKLGVSLLDALVGFETEIEHLDGHTVTIKSSKIIDCAHVMRLEDEGMPDTMGGFGDLIVSFDIEFPTKKFNKKNKKLLESLLE